MSRILKQTIYGLLFLLFWVLVGSGVYLLWFRPTPSCVNGVRDRNEEGIDCGGACTTICLPSDLRPIEVIDEVMIFYPDKAHISLLAKIQNPNLKVGVRRFGYRFDLFDDHNVNVRSLSGTSFIYGAEVNKYITGFFDAKNIPPIARAELSLLHPEWENAARFVRPDLKIQNFETRDGSGQLVVSGRVRNNDTINIPEVALVAIFKDRSGTIVGVSETKIENVRAGDDGAFTILHPPITDVRLEATEVAPFSYRP